MFFMLILRFWCHCIDHREYFFECLFSHQSKSFFQICREVFASWRYWGMFPFEYFSCKLYRKNPERSIPEIVDYVQQYYFDHVLIPKKNDRIYQIILENKIILDKLLASRSIPRPKVLFTVEGGQVLDNSGTRIKSEDFTNILANCKKALFVKPANGRGGTGIEVFDPTDADNFCNKSGQLLELDFLENIGNANDYIVQEAVEQIDILNNIFPHSINTIRIASTVVDGCVVPIAAILRIGRYKNRVDNSAQGGISVQIDLDSWCLAGKGYSEHPVASYDSHPETACCFRKNLPMKKQVMDLLNRTASIIPKCHILGWDVALTPQGPVIIEVNPSFGLNHVQIVCQRGIRKDLGI